MNSINCIMFILFEHLFELNSYKITINKTLSMFIFNLLLYMCNVRYLLLFTNHYNFIFIKIQKIALLFKLSQSKTKLCLCGSFKKDKN